MAKPSDQNDNENLNSIVTALCQIAKRSKVHLQPTVFSTVCFYCENLHCLSQRSDWMNFSFGGIFVYENCSTARNACTFKTFNYCQLVKSGHVTVTKGISGGD